MVAVHGPKDRPNEGEAFVPDHGWIQHRPADFYKAVLRNMNTVPSRHRLAAHVRLEHDGDEPSRYYRIETEDRAFVFRCDNHEPSQDPTEQAARFAPTRYSMDEIEGFLTDAIAHRH